MNNNDKFIPGQWLDTVDVTDFVNLNKKPFFKSPVFLKVPTEKTISLLNKTKKLFENEKWDIDLAYSSILPHTKQLVSEDESITGLFDINLNKKVGFSESLNDIISYYRFKEYPVNPLENKPSYHLFDDVATSDIQKALKINLFSNSPSDFSPGIIHPDIRKVVLYGTKQIIKDKKWYLKSLEKQLQTNEWIERRIIIHQEIEALKKLDDFCKTYGLNVTRPSSDAKEAVRVTYLTILACYLENPSVSFSLTQVLPFLDIYIENDISEGKLSEDEAQEIIDQFYIKLCTLRFVHSPKIAVNHPDYPHFFGETIGGTYITKTTYRFLHALRNFNLYPFALRILVDPSTPIPFKEYCETLIDEGIPISFFNTRIFKRNKDVALFPFGQAGDPGQEIALDGGGCDLLRVFHLALNGGKDVEENINFSTVTQPARKDILIYEEVFEKFKDFMGYILNIYVEKVNIVFYLNETHLKHSLRSSLMDSMVYYKVQFGFTNTYHLIQLLSSIKNNDYKVVRDKKGWIKEIEFDENIHIDETLVAQLVRFLSDELSKLPIYKNGKSFIRFYDTDIFEITSNFKNVLAVPPEYIPAIFYKNLNSNEPISFKEIDEYFSSNITELNVSTNPDLYIMNGIVYDKKFNLRS